MRFIYTDYILIDRQEKVNKCAQIRSDEMQKNPKEFLFCAVDFALRRSIMKKTPFC